MEYRGVAIVCPACRHDLRTAGEALRCTSCAREYPVLHGIPDLRLWPDPYIGFEEDRAKAARLAVDCASLGFADSVELYYRQTTVVPAFQAMAFTRGLLAAAGRAAHSMARWERACPGDTRSLHLLEIGCGTSPLLVGAAPRYRAVAGIDIAIRWLILARKRLDEAGIDVPLFCACAEALPFAAQAFDRVVADSTIEVIRDQGLGTSEAFRVMRDHGCMFVATPNRFSVGPDPHAGLWAGGWLPKRVLDAYVRAKGGIPPQRRLLSANGLRRLLERTGFVDVRVSVPDVPPEQRAGFGAPLRTVIDAYNGVVATRPGRAALSRIGPLLEAVARRPAGADRVSPAAVVSASSHPAAASSADRTRSPR